MLVGLKLLKPYCEPCAGSLSFLYWRSLLVGGKISHNKKISLKLIKDKQQTWIINNAPSLNMLTYQKEYDAFILFCIAIIKDLAQ